MHHPQELESEPLLETGLKHNVNTNFIQALLYVTEARKVDANWTAEDLPRTSYTTKDRPQQGRLRYHLYQIAFTKYIMVHHVMETNVEPYDQTQAQGFHADTRSKVVQLLPLAFEAILFMTANDTMGDSSLASVGLLQLMDQASSLSAPAKTFASLADLTLSSAMRDGSDGYESLPVLPLPTALELLCKIINAIRCQSEYDVVRASRWIRCVVQMVLDHGTDSDNKTNLSKERESHIRLVESTVDEALSLARDASNDGKGDVYPSDELHWLSTTLFNLAIDYCNVDQEDEAKMWALKAVEVADVLGRNPRDEGGDEGALSRILRERCRSLRWS